MKISSVDFSLLRTLFFKGAEHPVLQVVKLFFPARFMMERGIARLVILLISCLIAACQLTPTKSSADTNSYQIRQRILAPGTDESQVNLISYWHEIKPILDKRCVVCHACYDAPCQLKLGSIEGVDRGATKQKIYGDTREKPAQPTRLFVDANSTEEWRHKDFFGVLNETSAIGGDAELANSLLARMLRLKHDNPLPSSGKLPDSYKFDLDRDLQCPTLDEVDKFAQEHPGWGMPYAFPGLTTQEQQTVFTWLEQGAKVTARPPVPKAAQQQLMQWEQFLNGISNKQQLVGRYIYEHLFLGHLHFQGRPKDEFFTLVRSKTPPGEALDEITTLLPYDDPKVATVYYRLKPILETIVDKTHFVYELSPQRMNRYRELFFNPNYVITNLPGYQAEEATNPFQTFVQIPASSRYQFLLDDAAFFVSGFIKGPVCRGQIALNDIQDRFWILFVKPRLEFADQGANFLASHSAELSLPTEEGENIGLLGWMNYKQLSQQYLLQKEGFIKQMLDKYQTNLNLDSLWDGNQVNPNAALTVFRHFDSATVVQGLVGNTPKTAWVVDYPILERLHYLLVAGFDVYGTVGHQLAARKYMDYLRIDAENNFLRFMPRMQRQTMHDAWYVDILPEISGMYHHPLFNIEHETGIVFHSTHFKQDFFTQVQVKLGTAAGPVDQLNRCQQQPCQTHKVSKIQKTTDDALRHLATLQGELLDTLPEMSFLRVSTDNAANDLIYTLLLDKDLKNISMMLAEDLRRVPQKDRLTIVPGFLGSYPNFFFNVDYRQLATFVTDLENIKTAADKERFYVSYGIRRSNSRFWHYADWFTDKYLKEQGLNAGLFDLNRYDNL